MSLSFSQNTLYAIGSTSPYLQSAVSHPVVRMNHSSQTAVYWKGFSKQSGKKTFSYSPLSFRSSEQTYRSVNSGGGVMRATTYYVRPSSGSFVNAHGEVMKLIDFKPVYYGIGVPNEGDEGYVPPTGELDPDFASPVGDVLLPMLLMVGVYAVVRWFKNWKRKRTENRLLCIK